MAGGSMIDNDFEDDDLEVGGDDRSFKDDAPSKEEDKLSDASGKQDVEIEVIDDTPPDDKGKWTADEKATADALDDEDEKIKYGKSVRERIAKETAKVHAERRAKEERERQLAEASTLMKRLIKENNDLKGLVENGEKVLVSEHQGRLESQLDAAKRAYREALEAGDVNGQIAAQENLAKVAAQMDRLTTHRINPIPRMDEKEVDRFATPAPQPTPDEAAVAWQEKNRWFLKDEAMTAYAMAYHNRLVTQEGIEPKDGQKYWNAIDKEMRQRFPERFRSEGTTQQPRRTESIVAPATRDGGGKVTRKVTLTESQVRLASRLGLTPQQYAEQYVAQGSSKEWTHG